MYLSKLRIFGFKSFANRVEVNFPGDGITSVVGPNGCGKSNIIDAIRWVLGEQRAKALRSSKMEDVIFSGTHDRPALNLAEVSLMINNTSGRLPSEYSQVMITRRAFRNGDSEYLINNQPCRLKDIHNLFYDTGMGAASYSLIEAKMIDSILSDKADERRTMFEEASGISKYKQQRKETLRQLERTAQDLARVEDNLRHVQQNVAMFERQAKKAERWKELRTQYVSLELSYQYDSYLEFAAQSDKLIADKAKAENSLALITAKLATHETELEEQKLLLVDDEKALAELNQKVALTQGEVIRLENESERLGDREQHIDESLTRLEAENTAALGRIDQIAAQRKDAYAEIERLTVEANQLSNLGEGQAEERARQASAFQERRRRADELAEQRLLALEELGTVRKQLGATDAEIQLLTRQEGELEASFETASERLHSFKDEERKSLEELSRLEKQVEEQAHRKETLSADLQAAMAELEKGKAELQAANQEKAGLQARHALLRRLEESHEGVDAGVQHLMKNEASRIAALLADVLQAPPDILPLLERALGRHMQVLLVSDTEQAEALLQVLRQAKKGEALLFALQNNSLAGSGSTRFIRQRPDLSAKPGFKGWLIDAVKAPEGYGDLLEAVIGQHARVESLAQATAMVSTLPQGSDFWFWTDSGEALHASGLTLGGVSVAGTGLMQRKAEIEQTAARLREVEAKIAQLSTDLAKREQERAETQKALTEVESALRPAERAVQEHRSKLVFLAKNMEAIDKDHSGSRLRLETAREQLAMATERRGELGDRLAELEEERQVVENQFQSAMGELKEAEEARARFEDQLRNLERNKSGLESSIRQAQTGLQYLDKSEAEQKALLQKHATQREEWEVQRKLLRERLAEVEAQVGQLHERLAIEERDRDAAKAIYDSKSGRLEEIRTQIRSLNDEQRELTAKQNDAAVKGAQIAAALQGIKERMFELHEVDFSQEEVEFTRCEYDPSTAPQEIQSLKDKLKNLGNINTGALEDYETEKKKLEDVEKQWKDLEKARAGLEKAIKKLDKVAREQFLETFGVVQRNFQEVFSTLFEGGEAQLALEDGIDPLDAKIEINARPTGKKMRGVSLLSGGERALTAVSLLFALYLVRPSPYCIMDEVDGPLDDANIGRFVNLLRRFSHQTQFIVVTHNKRTMAASDMLYGVTQEIKGISKLVSVQLDEASRIAA